MVTIRIKMAPKRRQGEWHLAHGMKYRTKRLAEEAIAHMGREFTRILRELNDIYRTTCAEAQGLAINMDMIQLRQFARLKAMFDNGLSHIANTYKCPTYVTASLRYMAGIIGELHRLCLELPKMRYTGAATTLERCARDAKDILQQVQSLYGGSRLLERIPT